MPSLTVGKYLNLRQRVVFLEDLTQLDSSLQGGSHVSIAWKRIAACGTLIHGDVPVVRPVVVLVAQAFAALFLDAFVAPVMVELASV